MLYPEQYLKEAAAIIEKIDRSQIEKMIEVLLKVRSQKGRLFFIGVGGSAGNCSHAVNDFRKIAGFEAYTPVDNISELTARTNDEGWHTVFSQWLKGSNLNTKDCLFVFSVGGGDRERNISVNIVDALDYAKGCKAKIVGVVGHDGGYTAKLADACLTIPVVNPDTITPQTEAFQGVIWHLIVSDPRVMQTGNKWESTLAHNK
ncbi:MAG: SIS domain-containing protein [Candidatus Omnitrophica bacterium]|nr:SIS domain-containing protein [Candidatus Omnitrophota bacterium]MBU2266404.1 SIS domain-containing protein [Candidatus Omnitrophota bacterium]